MPVVACLNWCTIISVLPWAQPAQSGVTRRTASLRSRGLFAPGHSRLSPIVSEDISSVGQMPESGVYGNSMANTQHPVSALSADAPPPPAIVQRPHFFYLLRSSPNMATVLFKGSSRTCTSGDPPLAFMLWYRSIK